MWRPLTVLAALVLAASALPAQEVSRTENDLEGYSDCYRKDSTTCLKYKFFSFVDKMLGQKETFSLAEGITVVKSEDAAPETGAPRSLDPFDRLKKYFESHSIRVELKGSDVLDAASSAGRALEETVDSFTEEEVTEEGRGKKKKAAKILGPLIAAVALKAAALVPLALGAIALIAGKALLIGKIALVLSAIIGLKKLLSQQKHVTYEVVAHPHHSSSHSSSSHADFGGSGYADSSGGYGASSSPGGSSHGGWGRSVADDAQSLAYSAQKP